MRKNHDGALKQLYTHSLSHTHHHVNLLQLIENLMYSTAVDWIRLLLVVYTTVKKLVYYNYRDSFTHFTNVVTFNVRTRKVEYW